MEQDKELISTTGRSLDGEVKDLADPEDYGSMYFKQNSDGSMSGYVELATGSVIQRNDFSTVTWEQDPSWNAGMYGTGVPASPKAKIKKAVKYYSRDPLVNKSITLLAQLSNDSFRISSENSETETFFKEWWKDLGGTLFITDFFREYFRSGNVPIFKTLIPYRPKIKKGQKVSKATMNLSKASEQAEVEYQEAYEAYRKGMWHEKRGNISSQKLTALRQTYAAKKLVWSKRMIPAAYTILNPLSIDIEGPEQLPWLRQLVLTLDDDVVKSIKSPPKGLKPFIDLIPSEIVAQVRAGKTRVVLPEYLATMVTRDKQPYEKWAEPLTSHTFEALDYKYELRAMDVATVRGVRNRILKVTTGNDANPCFDPTQLQRLAREFNNPSRNLTIFWNHTLSIEYIEPSLESLNMDKYEPVSEDIRACFGIAKNLTGNTGESLGNNVLNLKGLIELLSEAQESFLGWFNNEVKLIAEAVGLSELPEGSFSKINLKDENEFIKVITQLVDRQIISYETATETIGFYFPRELKRLRKEQKIREKDSILVAQKAPTQQESSVSGQEGRPSGTPEGNRPTRVNKPKQSGGLKMVASIDPVKLSDLSKEIAECFEQTVAELQSLYKSTGKKITKANTGEIFHKAWSTVTKLFVDKYNIAVDSDDMLLISLMKAKTTQGIEGEKGINDLLPPILASELLHSTGE